MSARVAWIHTTPVKGLALQERDEVTLTRRGADGDRDFLLVTEGGAMVSSVRIGSLLQVRAAHRDGRLSLAFAGGETVEDEVALGPEEDVQFYRLRMPVRPVLGPFSAALSAHAGQALRLVAAPPQRGAVDRGAQGAVTLLSTASLEDLAAQGGFDAPVDPRRFRMTIGVEGVGAYEEDGWVGREVAVGEAALRVTGQVGRCVLTTRDADSGEVDLPVLQVLGDYRDDADATEPLPFGVHAAVVRDGRVAVGDAVAF